MTRRLMKVVITYDISELTAIEADAYAAQVADELAEQAKNCLSHDPKYVGTTFQVCSEIDC